MPPRVESICESPERGDSLLGVRPLGGDLGQEHSAFVCVLCVPFGEVGQETFDSRLDRCKWGLGLHEPFLHRLIVPL